MTTERPGREDRPVWLWFVGLAALPLGIAAFLLWGLNGAGYVFDLLVAYCF